MARMNAEMIKGRNYILKPRKEGQREERKVGM